MRVYIDLVHIWRMCTRTCMRGELRGFRAHEGSSNEKPHYFLMHLLIDQSRKGSAPPTLRPPLPSVNHSRNNLMIGALVLLSRLPRRSLSSLFVSGTIMTPRFGKSFSSSHVPLLRFCSLRYAWTTKKAMMGTCARYARKREKGSHSRAYSLVSRSSGMYSTSTSGWTSCATSTNPVREKIVYDHTAEREKNWRFLRASFHSNTELSRRVNARPTKIFGIHEIKIANSQGSSRFPLTEKYSSRK